MPADRPLQVLIPGLVHVQEAGEERRQPRSAVRYHLYGQPVEIRQALLVVERVGQELEALRCLLNQQPRPAAHGRPPQQVAALRHRLRGHDLRPAVREILQELGVRPAQSELDGRFIQRRNRVHAAEQCGIRPPGRRLAGVTERDVGRSHAATREGRQLLPAGVGAQGDPVRRRVRLFPVGTQVAYDLCAGCLDAAAALEPKQPAVGEPRAPGHERGRGGLVNVEMRDGLADRQQKHTAALKAVRFRPRGGCRHRRRGRGYGRRGRYRRWLGSGGGLRRRCRRCRGGCRSGGSGCRRR